MSLQNHKKSAISICTPCAHVFSGNGWTWTWKPMVEPNSAPTKKLRNSEIVVIHNISSITSKANVQSIVIRTHAIKFWLVKNKQKDVYCAVASTLFDKLLSIFSLKPIKFIGVSWEILAQNFGHILIFHSHGLFTSVPEVYANIQKFPEDKTQWCGFYRQKPCIISPKFNFLIITIFVSVLRWHKIYI